MPVSTLAIYDERNMPHPTIRHTKCDILIEKGNGIRCRVCNEYRYIIMTRLIIYNNGNNYYTTPTLHSLASKIKSCDGTPHHKSIHQILDIYLLLKEGNEWILTEKRRKH